MAAPINMPEKKKQGFGLGDAGELIGSYFGAGGAGRTIGDAFTPATQQASPVQYAAQQGSSPLERRMKSLRDEPINQLREGRAALAQMDQQSQQELSPIIDEALRRASQKRTTV